MLQQTRAQAVIPYYEKFLDRFPSAQALAEAEDADVLRHWAGLGYYQRARNLQRAARRIVELGAFPREYDAIRELPGVGPYTAAAVASIAFGARHASVDGNVLRVIARYTADPADIGSPATKARFEAVANQLLDRRDPGRFNQAMMELGATVCLPRNPLCLLCPVAGGCQGRIQGSQSQLPVKLGKRAPTRIETTLLLVERDGSVLLWRRDPNATHLGGFWELPSSDDLPKTRAQEKLGSFRHSIMDRDYTITVARAKVTRVSDRFQWFAAADLRQIPLSTTARKAMALAARSHL